MPTLTHNSPIYVLRQLLMTTQASLRGTECYSTFWGGNSYIIDKQFVQFEGVFKSQFENLSHLYGGLDFNLAKQKFAESISSLLELCPDAISMELTHERSIFYTIKKDDYTFFLQHFFEHQDEDEDEAIVTIFRGVNKLPSFAGTLGDTILEISSYILLPANTTNIELPEYEFSF